MKSPVLSFARVALRDLLGKEPPGALPSKRLAAVGAWLERAQDATPDDGVSDGYALRGGWRPSDVGATAEVALAFFDLARAWSAPRMRERAVRATDWLLSVQGGDGWLPSALQRPRRGSADATGPGLLALVRAIEETREERYRKAAREAGDWLVETAGSGGTWTRPEQAGDAGGARPARTADTTVAWALLELARVEGESEYANAGWQRVARACLDRIAGRQRPDGLIDEAAGTRSTDSAADLARGLLEAWRLEGEGTWLEAVRKLAAALRGRLREDGFLPGELAEAAASYGSPAANCRMAFVWARLHGNVEREGDQASRKAAVGALRWALGTQDVGTGDLDVRGAVPGSHPVWGKHAPLAFPSRAGRAFADALQLCEPWLG